MATCRRTPLISRSRRILTGHRRPATDRCTRPRRIYSSFIARCSTADPPRPRAAFPATTRSRAICHSSVPRTVPCAAAGTTCWSGSSTRITATCATETGSTQATVWTVLPRAVLGVFPSPAPSRCRERAPVRIFTSARNAGRTGTTRPGAPHRFERRLPSARDASARTPPPKPTRNP